MIRRAPSTAALLIALTAPEHALAGDAALAESLFQQGLELMDKGDHAAACPKLEESFAQDEATGTLLALALCQEQAGRTASAWARYAEVMSRAQRDGRPDREQAARDKMQALEPLLSRLTIEVEPSVASLPGLIVKRDGVPIGQGAWGASAPVDPGEHAVEAAAPGKRPWTVLVTIAASADSQVVRVPLLDDAPSEPVVIAAPPPPLPSAPSPATADSVAPSEGISLRTLGLVVGGVGIVGLGVSAYLGVHGKGLYEDSNRNGCDARNECDSTGLALRASAVRETDAATVTLIVGGVLTATGVTLFLVGGPKGANPETATIEATPAVGPRGAAMLVRGHF